MGTMMSQQEAKRAQIMELLTAGNLDQKEAARIGNLNDLFTIRDYIASPAHGQSHGV